MMLFRGPFKVLGSEVKYKNPWMTVREDKIIKPDGSEGIWGVMQISGGVGILPINNEGNVYLVKQFRYAINAENVEIPSGFIDEDETPLEAAKRELKEELGIVASEWTDLGITHPAVGYVENPVTLFIAERLSFADSHPESDERIEMIKVSLEEAVKMVMKNKITSLISAVLIMKANETRKK